MYIKITKSQVKKKIKEEGVFKELALFDGTKDPNRRGMITTSIYETSPKSLEDLEKAINYLKTDWRVPRVGFAYWIDEGEEYL